MKKDIFLVDADDTILDFHGSAMLAIQGAFEALHLEWKAEYEGEYKAFNAKLWEALERKEITRDELMNTRFIRFLVHIGVEADGEKFNQEYIEYLSTHPQYLEGAQDFLCYLRSQGRVYIVTNGTEYIQKSRFAIAKLQEYCDGIFISQTAGADKPDKKYTEYVVARIENFDAQRALWIGDSLSADIKAANDAKIDSVWFNPHKKSANGGILPTYDVCCFGEIVEILQKNFGSNN